MTRMVINDVARITCDLCARQIVHECADDKYTTGPMKEAHHIGFGKHCCHKCWPDYVAEEQELMGKAEMAEESDD